MIIILIKKTISPRGRSTVCGSYGASYATLSGRVAISDGSNDARGVAGSGSIASRHSREAEHHWKEVVETWHVAVPAVSLCGHERDEGFFLLVVLVVVLVIVKDRSLLSLLRRRRRYGLCWTLRGRFFANVLRRR